MDVWNSVCKTKINVSFLLFSLDIYIENAFKSLNYLKHVSYNYYYKNNFKKYVSDKNLLPNRDIYSEMVFMN